MSDRMHVDIAGVGRACGATAEYSIDCLRVFLYDAARTELAWTCQPFGGTAVIVISGIAAITAMLAPRYRRRLLKMGRWAEAVEGAPVIL